MLLAIVKNTSALEPISENLRKKSTKYCIFHNVLFIDLPSNTIKTMGNGILTCGENEQINLYHYRLTDIHHPAAAAAISPVIESYHVNKKCSMHLTLTILLHYMYILFIS